MSPRIPRAQSAEPRFMAPTIASNARAGRATSAEPTIPTNPSCTRVTPANSRAGSVQTSTSAGSVEASTSAAASPKPIESTTKARSKVEALASRVGLTLSKTPSSSQPVPAKPSQKGLHYATAAPAFEGSHRLQRTGYGDARAAREDQMGATMAATAQAKGLIDDETANNWGTSWHTKGHIELNWTEQIIAKHNAENGIVPEKLMSLKEAEAIKKKKDQDLEEWCKAFTLGLIDENGNPTGSGTPAPIAKSKSRERDARREAAKKEAEKKDPLHKVQESRVAKKVVGKKTPQLPTIAEASSVSPFLGLKPAAKKAGKKTTAKPAEAAPKNNPPQKAGKVVEAPIVPLPGCPSYAEYKYPDLSALCRVRNIKSGGGEQDLRNRLIRDDIFVKNGQLNLRDAKNYLSRKDHDHPAPTVPGAPIAGPAVYTRPAPKQRTKKTAKRARDDDDDDQPKPKGKKVKTA
ncbi:hypothetical protein P171DRAFT_515821 [Karstenula rhodostoma CBS 690.94]|uniref:Uncharacterized protein n=1 Tax=Karstenula rhodostoma CBS 690.94 TaxID=1392251 RepID=A0A9P4UJN9_9PLEO|nr:hypothetical protein P171DRAFT_515821 [Karstenula rhodostoma CBS 690.94]